MTLVWTNQHLNASGFVNRHRILRWLTWSCHSSCAEVCFAQQFFETAPNDEDVSGSLVGVFHCAFAVRL